MLITTTFVFSRQKIGHFSQLYYSFLFILIVLYI
jgi:hypothetical protein